MNERHIFVMNDALMTMKMKIFIDDEDEGTKTNNFMTVDGDGRMVVLALEMFTW